MIYYFIALALGLYFIYALRDALLILQNRRDRKEALRLSLYEQSRGSSDEPVNGRRAG